MHPYKCLPVNDETLDAHDVIRDNVGGPDLLPAEGLLPEKVSLVQVPDKLLLAAARLFLCHLDLRTDIALS